MTSQQVAMNQLAETIRSNKAKEAETERSNRAKERETEAHNRVSEVTERSRALNNPFSLISYGANNSSNAVEGIGNLAGNLGILDSFLNPPAFFKKIIDSADKTSRSSNSDKYLR